jgi:glycosyltransferase involved in cell wall biosynthesis
MTISSRSDPENTPSVSVVIPAYNAARYIGQALDSLHAQSLTDYEVIVVNDGSTDRDELEQVLRSHPLSIIYLTQPNRGVSAARNAAINVARGKFYAQLDADDQWTPDYLAVQLGILSANPEAALVYPNAMIISDSTDEELEYMSINPSEGEVTFQSLVRRTCTVMTCVTARMSVIRDVGMFDEGLRTCEDFDLWLRLTKNDARIIYHRRPLALYRRRQGSLSSDRAWMSRHILTVLAKCARTLNLTAVEAQAVDEELVRVRAKLRVYEGKRALRAGGTGAALVHFKAANEYLRSRKLQVVMFLLRHLPNVAVWSFATRERLRTFQRDRHLAGIDEPRMSSTEAFRASQ